jgi:hypothetical protein
VTSYAQRREASLARSPVDLRSLFSSSIRDQGARPLCVPFSIAGAHEATRSRLVTAGAEMLAVEPLWQYCLKNGNTTDSGTTLTAGEEAVRAKGQTAASYWPYNDSLGSGTEPEPAAATDATWYTAGIIGMRLAHDGIEQLTELALAGGLPVILVIELTQQFEQPTHQGEIAVPPLNAPDGDYHAVLVVGAATSDDGTSRRLLIRNSWGPGWGAGGHGWLPLDYLIAFARQAAAIDPTSLAMSSSNNGGS